MTDKVQNGLDCRNRHRLLTSKKRLHCWVQRFQRLSKFNFILQLGQDLYIGPVQGLHCVSLAEQMEWYMIGLEDLSKFHFNFQVFSTLSVMMTEIFSHNSFAQVPLPFSVLTSSATLSKVSFRSLTIYFLSSYAKKRGRKEYLCLPEKFRIMAGHSPSILHLEVVSQ